MVGDLVATEIKPNQPAWRIATERPSQLTSPIVLDEALGKGELLQVKVLSERPQEVICHCLGARISNFGVHAQIQDTQGAVVAKALTEKLDTFGGNIVTLEAELAQTTVLEESVLEEVHASTDGVEAKVHVLQASIVLPDESCKVARPLLPNAAVPNGDATEPVREGSSIQQHTANVLDAPVAD